MRAGLILLLATTGLQAQLAIRGDIVHTMAGAALKDAIVLVNNGKIERVGPASQVQVPSGYRSIAAKVVTPGLIDAHTVVGVSGYLNQPHDQDQVERSGPAQPELRAIDSYDSRERLVDWVRGFGVTTIHTGHGPGTLISGQTMIAKTAGATAEQAIITPAATIAATLGSDARAEQGKSPGTRAKMIAMFRTDLIKAQEYAKKSPATRDLRVEALIPVVKREMPLMITVHKAGDILTAIRLAKEFDLKLIIDGAADAHMVIEQIKASGYPVLLHPTMARSTGDAQNLSMETAQKLRAAGILFALQSGFEGYVPKTRVALWEAGVAAANGLSFDHALASVTIDAARILGLDKRVGSIEPGKDGDLALYDGDPFEYTSHCVGVVIDGKVVSQEKR
jgi:imidazolonepropionase-like amidohydrolase